MASRVNSAGGHGKSVPPSNYDREEMPNVSPYHLMNKSQPNAAALNSSGFKPRNNFGSPNKTPNRDSFSG